MNEFVSRTEPVASVASVQPRSVPVTLASSTLPRETREVTTPPIERPIATTNYARIQSDIARALKAVQDRQPTPTAADMGSAESAMLNLMPQPVITLPMPPTDIAFIEFVAQVAQSLAQQMMLSRAAQARVPINAVDALVA